MVQIYHFLDIDGELDDRVRRDRQQRRPLYAVVRFELGRCARERPSDPQEGRTVKNKLFVTRRRRDTFTSADGRNARAQSAATYYYTMGQHKATLNYAKEGQRGDNPLSEAPHAVHR